MDFDDFAFGPDAMPAPAEQHQPPPVPESAPAQHPELALATHRARPRAGTAARAKAGLGVIVAAAGAGVGSVVLGGPLGALTGLTAVGTVRNLYRSQGLASEDPAEKGDAARSLALAVVGLAIVGYLGYRIYNRKEDHS